MKVRALLIPLLIIVGCRSYETSPDTPSGDLSVRKNAELSDDYPNSYNQLDSQQKRDVDVYRRISAYKNKIALLDIEILDLKNKNGTEESSTQIEVPEKQRSELKLELENYLNKLNQK